jgi:NAD(P)-dependent dehydrogenase (short-subunit alcohol dehydrogenase family)
MLPSVFRENVLHGRAVLVTGGGTGIGLRTARELAHLGATVILASRREEVIRAAAERIRSEGGAAHAIPVNVRDEESVTRCVAEAIRLGGRLDALVNNAGGQFPAEAADITRKGWDAVIETNLTGPFLMARAVFDGALRAGGGAIVNVLANVRNGFPTMAHTGAARAGVDNLTKSLALEWGRFGVRVNAVAPGVIDSSGLDSYGPEMKSRILQYGRFNQAGRLGTEAEVAAAIVFLLTPAARFITGVTLAVDGGESIYHPFHPPTAHDKIPPFGADDGSG